MPRITFWFDFASTYSYLSAMRIDALAAARGVGVEWQPFLLGPIFRAQGWESSPFNLYPAKGRYMWRDMDREAARLGLPPVVRPDPFPQNGLLAARVALIGAPAGWSADFSRAVFAAEFAEARQIADLDVLRAILAGLGIDPEPVLARSGDPAVKDALRAAGEQAAGLGIFGAPSFTCTDGELYWGNDRLEAALERAAASGGR